MEYSPTIPTDSAKEKRPLTLKERASGILLHPTSLPGPHGIGDVGSSADRFVDFLAASGQHWWQMLPIAPIGSGNSPYHAFSAFAGNPLLISLDNLAEEGLLHPGEIPRSHFKEERVDYEAVKRYKEPLLRKAFFTFKTQKRKNAAFEGFFEKNKFWLEDYSLFSALKTFYQGRSWSEWDPAVRAHRAEALAGMKKRLEEEIFYHQFVQFVFLRQWSRLKEYCLRKNIGLIGDIPIFVSHDSADVWAHQEFFWLDEKGKPSVVSGVPPDYFSKTGQRWGDPLYRWDRLRERDYPWWCDRFRITFERFQVARLDHFIGFHRFWEIPASQRTALRGRWVAGPGADFFEKVLALLGPLELIAEDLGLVTPEVKALRDQFGFPGIRVLQFAFGNEQDTPQNDHFPGNYPKRCIVYTGTHDNDTLLGWFSDTGSRASTRSRDQIQKERLFALKYLASDGREFHWDMIRLAMTSAADVAIFPLQDILGLGSVARMNLPGTAEGNWEWRFGSSALSQTVTNRLRELTESSGRLPT